MTDGGLYEAFLGMRPALHRYLQRRGARDDEAEDILQEVLLTLSSGKTGPVSEPGGYLYRMATNHFLIHRRGAVRRARREEDWVGAHTGDPPDLDEAPSAETSLIARQQLAILQSVIDRLPERTRTIFRRFRIEGETRPSIASDLEISISAVEKHLARAYEAITAVRLRLDEDKPLPRHLTIGKDGHGA
ncbi:RNA polymerase sigma-70 factor, ECF subfamily [Novosphingobium sp. CF614]|uniref:RNA polymerase sigma factor n=1 Tax=Novosphingobium sp. CF614 TaxID=1884364 RepID=UPI0008EE74AE|nr:sigma-70 family RNA polymerase sigma factor [Novosphingobium sp. CF614]SFG04390.1 RNA polymerase sigma-70 factor, ECF subfamily [Novosphingobium sp. CF614]